MNVHRMLIVTCLALGGLPAPAFSQEGEVQVRWLKSPTQAAQLAAQTGKPILVYVRSASCHYCDLMQRDVWQNPETVADIEKNFIPLKLTREENPESVQAMQVKGFPSTLFFSPERAYLHRVDGYLAAGKFAAEMRTAQRIAAAPSAPVR